MLMPHNIEKLAALGANLDLTAATGLMPHTLEQIVALAAQRGAHVTVSAAKLQPQTLEKLAELGRNHLTIRVE